MGLRMTLSTVLSAADGRFMAADCNKITVTSGLNSFQRLVSFMTDLQGADYLLQKAIRKVDGSKKMDTAQVK